MSKQAPATDKIEFVVGAERRLGEIVGPAEVMPLLQGAVQAGACRAGIEDPAGKVLWSWGEEAGAPVMIHAPLFLEGEPVGKLVIQGPAEKDLAGLRALFLAAFNSMVANNLKRMLTTEIHTTVVNASYEELLETNQRLTASEAKYRELAAHLEEKVEQRGRQLKKLHGRLLQQEKMAAIGQLAAGMAHEINNPLGFVTSNLATLKQYIGRFAEMLTAYRTAMSAQDGEDDKDRAALTERWRKLKIDFLLEDVQELLLQSEEGCGRIKGIVADLKGFAHLDESQTAVVDLNQELDRTLKVLMGQLPPDTRITRDYQPLPGFACQPARLAQVFLNILLNAAQAKPSGLQLELATRCGKNALSITIGDNGPGIPPGIRSRIFEPFFTTREVGAGKGLGLTAAYQIITSHGGKIEIADRPGGGTRVIILLPVKAA